MGLSYKYVANANLGILASLIDKSLIQKVQRGIFTMHEILKKYARKKLSENPEDEKNTIRWYIDYYSEFLKVYKEVTKFSTYRSFFTEVGMELENIRAAWRYILDRKCWDKLTGFISPIFQFHLLKGLLKEGEKIFKDAIKTIESKKEDNRAILVKLYNKLGSLLYKRGLYDEAKRYFDKSLDILKDFNDSYDEIYALLGKLEVLHCIGNYKQAKELINRALKLAETYNNKLYIARCLNNLGIVEKKEGNFNKALDLYKTALEIARKESFDCLRVSILINIGNINCLTGNTSEGREYYKEAIADVKELGLKRR